jgi:outer membrane protein TolC
VGVQEPANFNLPLDKRMEEAMPDDVSLPTVWLSMDSVKNSQDHLQQEASVPPSDTDPQLQTYAYLADSAKFSAAAVQSELLPKISLSAQAGYENPDGPILQTEQQNIVSVSLSMPIFDWGQIISDSDAKQKQAEAYEKDWAQTKTDLWRDWNKGRDVLRSLKYQQKINETAVSETKELARLTYKSYKAGTVRFLEVQTANSQSLNAKVLAVSNDVQILMQLSVLSSLAGNKE